MKKIILFLLTLLILNFGYTQKVYEWYQDGVVIFQVKTDSKYHIPADKYEVQLENVRFLQEVISEFGITQVNKLLYYHPDEKLNHTFQVNFTEIQKVAALIEAIEQNHFIEYAEKKERHIKLLTPNDMGANSTTGTGMWHLYTMQAEQAWDLSTGSSNVVVAVTDDAILTTHPDLTGKFVAGNDASDQNSSDPNPCNGNDGNHGTHVSGTVGATTNNGSGTSASLGWDVSIMPVKIGRCSDGALTAGFEGLAWAANNGADVINMSWGGGGSSTFGQNTVDAAWAQGAILVAAAGNDGVNSVFYPAGYNNVISVASTTTNDSKSNFSNFGAWIDISAPGSAIRSTVANGGYDRYQGTSMASPNVSSLLGLMKSYAPNATNTDLINCLYSSADPVTSNAGEMGAGRINAFQALTCVSAFALQTDAGITQIIEPPTTICGNSFTPQVVLRNFGANPVTSVNINYTWGTVNANFLWTGNLTSGQSETVSLPLQTSVGSGSFTFSVTANLAGDQNGTNDTQTIAFLIDPNGQNTTFSLTTDCYGSETTWNIVNDLNVVVASGGPYTDITGGQTQNFINCLPIGCYIFTINDSYGDGLFGSQWGSCAVNGDYSMTDAGGANLFSMTAANGDFGNSTTHNFCIVNPNLMDDIGISEIIEPNGTYCSGSLNPQVRIRNFGNNIITTATISYNTGGANQTFNWTGNLTTGQTQLVNLPTITATNGSGVFTAITSLPNGQVDQNLGNDGLQSNFTAYTTGLPLPFTETFESNTFMNGSWTLSNPDGDVTWEIVTADGTTPGTKAAKMDFFNYAQSSKRDGMISPMLNLNSYSSATMTWEHAYRRFDQSTTDSLIVLVSTNCGATWTRVYAGGENSTGSFATASTNTNAFDPLTGQWCTGTVGANCSSVDLTAFVGNNVLVKFEGFNSGTIGNNLYVDNINITGVANSITADFSATNTSICPNGSVTFTNLSSSPGTLAWSFPGGNPATSSATSPIISYSSPGSYNVSLTITGAGGTDTETKNSYVTVLPPPSVSISGNNSFCAGSTTTLTANVGAGSGTISNYQWQLNGTNVGANQATLVTNLAGNYTVTVTNTTNCSGSSAAYSVNLNPTPTVAISGNTSFCSGSSTTLTANVGAGSGNISNYQWQLNGTNVGSNQATFVATTIGTYTVTITNTTNCFGTSSNFGISLAPNPTVSIVGNNSFCSGSSTTLTAIVGAGSGTISNYQWRRNGVNVGSNQATFVATIAGTYSLTVTNTTNCSGTSSNYVVSVNTSPSVSIVGNNSFCSGTNTILTANASAGSGNITNYQWRRNGSPIGSNIGQLTASQAGTYSVTVLNSNGCSATSSNFTLTENPPIVVNVTTTLANCNTNNGTASATANGGTNGFTFFWNTIPASSGPSISNLSAGSYELTVTETATGCSEIVFFFINNFGSPTIDSVSTEAASCLNGDLGSAEAFVNGGAGNYSYNWGVGNPDSSIITNLAAGNYTLTVTDGNLCASSIGYVINSITGPILDTALVENATCPSLNDGSIEVQISGGTGAYEFLWNNGDTTSINSDLSSGIYNLTVTDEIGCSTTYTDTLETEYSLDVNLIVTDNSATQGNSSIAANPVGGQNPYTFDWNDGQFSGSSIGPLSSGSYFINLTDANGCLVMDTAFIGSVGIATSELVAQLNLFPNPGTGNVQLNIEMEKAKVLSLNLVNTLGQTIWTTNWNANTKDQILIPSASFAKGIYYLKVQNEDKIQILPFTKIE